jgi:hypothetical protein
MPSYAEQQIADGLRSILSHLPDGAEIGDSPRFRDVQTAFEFFVTEVLVKDHAEWQRESLDGFFFLTARKTADLTAEFFGLCILIRDQTTTPISMRLQVSSSANELHWFECKLGDADENAADRKKVIPFDLTEQRVRALSGREDQINWVYQATFGQRRP